MTTRTDHAAELRHVLDVVFALPPQHAVRDALARARIVSVGQLLQLDKASLEELEVAHIENGVKVLAPISKGDVAGLRSHGYVS